MLLLVLRSALLCPTHGVVCQQFFPVLIVFCGAGNQCLSEDQCLFFSVLVFFNKGLGSCSGKTRPQAQGTRWDLWSQRGAHQECFTALRQVQLRCFSPQTASHGNAAHSWRNTDKHTCDKCNSVLWRNVTNANALVHL